MFFLYSNYVFELEDAMSKIFLVAVALIAALFGSVVTWALTARPAQAVSQTRALLATNTEPAINHEQTPNRLSAQGRPVFEPMTREVMERRLNERFAKTDANGDGFVTRSEAEGAQENARTKRRDAAFSVMDSDSNGTVSRPEFEAQANVWQRRIKQKRNKSSGAGEGSTQRRAMGYIGTRQFERMDANKDGRVSFNEALGLTSLRFKSSDTDGDGVLSQKERNAAREAMRGKSRANAARASAKVVS
jgi:EF hand